MNMREFGKWLVSNPGKLIISIVAIGLLLCVIFTFNHPGGSSDITTVKTPELNSRVAQKEYNLGPAESSGIVYTPKAGSTPTPATSMTYRQAAQSEEEKRTFRPLRFGSLPQEKVKGSPANQLQAVSNKTERDFSESAP